MSRMHHLLRALPVQQMPVHAVALVLLLVIFVSFNLFANTMFRSARLDLTENALFTLSPGTRNILAKLDEPVALKFYYSQEQAADSPAVRLLAGRVRDMLEEMVNAANGRLTLEIIDPAPFSEAEDRAVARGWWRALPVMGRRFISDWSAPIWLIMSKSLRGLPKNASNISNMIWRG